MSKQPSIEDVRKVTLVDPGNMKEFKLKTRPTHGDVIFEMKDDAKDSLDDDANAINELQDTLFASQAGSLLVVFQGIDTSGKDGTTKAVFKYTSPLGVRVHPFGKPTDMELAHDYLWRIHQVAPRNGHIAVFNRSHYEDVLVVKVRELAPKDRIEQRYEQINAFEKHLAENGTRILKFMLHISKEEQGIRLRERLEIPKKRWKFNPGDLEDRALWDDYQDAYETLLQRCSTAWAPWHVVPSDSRSRREAIVARIVRAELESMNLKYPDSEYRLDQFEID